MKVVVVIPTYNEKENIQRVIKSLHEAVSSVKQHEFVALVVDGNSPDGTADEVKSLAREFPFVQLLLEEKKAGLGAAYIQGFKYAMHKLNADVLVEMDGDMQHDPKDVVRLVKAIEDGADYAIGSRFVKGGEIPKEWAIHRKFLSVGGSMFSKFVLGIFNINDFTSGFKASRVNGFADNLDLDSVMSKGFAYKIDLLYKMHKVGAKFKEVPIVFALRDRGDSKMEKNNFMDSLKVVLSIRLRENQRFFKFMTVGFIGLGVDTGLFNVLRVVAFKAQYASAFSGLVAAFTTFVLNNTWSFSDSKIHSKGGQLKTLPTYLVVSYIPIILRSWLVKYSVFYFGDTFVVSNVAFFIGVLFGVVWNFTIYNKVIWKRSKIKDNG